MLPEYRKSFKSVKRPSVTAWNERREREEREEGLSSRDKGGRNPGRERGGKQRK